MSDVGGAELWGFGAIALGLIISTGIGLAWPRVRRVIAAIDVIVGRPPRYPDDPEQRPGLAQRLDTLDSNVNRLGTRVERIERHVMDREGDTL